MSELSKILKDATRKITGAKHRHRLFFLPDPNGVQVEFGNGRKQYVSVIPQGEQCRMTSVVIGSGRVERLKRTEVLLKAWERNREMNVVNFGLDKQGRLIGSIEHPIDNLQSVELASYIELLASECDRFEYLLSGHDIQ